MLGGLSCLTNICLVLYLNNGTMFFGGRTYSGENAPLALIAFSWHSIKAGHCITCRLLKSVCSLFCFSLTFMQRSHVLASTYNMCRVCVCQTSGHQKIRAYESCHKWNHWFGFKRIKELFWSSLFESENGSPQRETHKLSVSSLCVYQLMEARGQGGFGLGLYSVHVRKWSTLLCVRTP
jgi:hypothetical protein